MWGRASRRKRRNAKAKRLPLFALLEQRIAIVKQRSLKIVVLLLGRMERDVCRAWRLVNQTS